MGQCRFEWCLGFLDWDEPRAVHSSPFLLSSSSQPTPDSALRKEWSSTGSNFIRILIQHCQCILCHTIVALTFPWLPIILGFIFRSTVLWGILNIDMSCYQQKSNWVEEITCVDICNLNYVHLPRAPQIPLCHILWMRFSTCINFDAYNAFMLNLYFDHHLLFKDLLLWYGIIVMRAATLFIEAMKHEPPNRLLPSMQCFAQMTTMG